MEFPKNNRHFVIFTCSNRCLFGTIVTLSPCSSRWTGGKDFVRAGPYVEFDVKYADVAKWQTQRT